MTDFLWQFGERFRTIRKTAKLNQDEFGRILGVSRQTINAYENNRQRPPLDMMEKVCKLQSISPIWLLSGYGKPNIDKDYPESEGRAARHAIADEILSAEQKALMNFIAFNRERADKLAHVLMEQGLNSLGSGSKLDL
ncbi:MAG: helix-turn-helix transcriptional regulator [Candidatus Marinimicrobia bacterium]|nr:helix-turn-helix transcriptional regulator [Candidatus Neomarinimicrobiota bacterium]